MGADEPFNFILIINFTLSGRAADVILNPPNARSLFKTHLLALPP